MVPKLGQPLGPGLCGLGGPKGTNGGPPSWPGLFPLAMGNNVGTVSGGGTLSGCSGWVMGTRCLRMGRLALSFKGLGICLIIGRFGCIGILEIIFGILGTLWGIFCIMGTTCLCLGIMAPMGCKTGCINDSGSH